MKIEHKTRASLLPFDRERPYCLLQSIKRVEGDTPETKVVTFFIELMYLDGRSSIEPIAQSTFRKDVHEITLNNPFDLRDIKWCKVYFEWNDKREERLDANDQFYLKFEIIERFPTKIPAVGFDKHLADSRNIKILFSAPFGHGKTTFLEQFFKEREDHYRTFKLFPVNYSVAKNEDIFRYIKCELIVQLLEYPELFQKEVATTSETLTKFAGKNMHRILAPLLLMSQSMGRNMYTAFKEWEEIRREYLQYHIDSQTDEKLLSEGYVQDFFEQEGGFFEDNFYTQLIRKLLSRLKGEEQEKENVLIIDDLDRMDPDHIFRILNVFSAHYDSLHQGIHSEQNKFGFDRIVLVCDYDNLRKIYAYRYGPRVDFEGYINKYYSTEVFQYNNDRVMKMLIDNIDDLKSGSYQLGQKHNEFFRLVTGALLEANEISLRDVLKLRSIGLETQREHLKRYADSARIFPLSACAPAIMLLSKIGNANVLKSKIQQVPAELFKTINETEWGWQLIGLKGLKSNRAYFQRVGEKRISFVSGDFKDGFVTFKEREASNKEMQSPFVPVAGDKLNKEDLKVLLLEAIEFYDREQVYYN